MKKRSFLLKIIPIMFALCACGSTGGQKTMINLTMSEEAKIYEEEVIRPGYTKAILSETNYSLVLSSLNARQGQKFPECKLENRLDSFEYKGSEVYTLEKDNYKNIVLYIHGGAWAFQLGKDHAAFCDNLVNKLDAKVYMPLYPLAPQATSVQTYEMIEPLYKEILKEGKDVYVMGDSAGGNISLGLLYSIKKEGIEYPKKTVLLSPCADMSFSNEEMIELDKTDPELAVYGSSKLAELWAGKDNLKDPKNSAVYADVSGYPDIMIFHGTNDILYPDVAKLVDNLSNAKVNVTFVVGEGLWHVFPLDSIPEKETSLDLIAEFCSK